MERQRSAERRPIRGAGGTEFPQESAAGFRRRWLRFGVPAALVLWLLLVEGLLGGGQARIARAQTTDVPADVVAVLPQDATVLAAVSGDLTGDGATGWAVLYTQPDSSVTGYPITTPSVAAVLPDGNGGWSVGTTRSIKAAVGSHLSLANIGGVESIVFDAGVGAHAQQLIVLRWAGREFRTVFEQTDNTPNMALRDVDGDGVLEVVQQFSTYCEAYFTAPRLVAVWGWNGFQFVEDTGRYPAAIASAQADVQSAFTHADSDNWRADGVACLHGALAYLADKSGDQATAAAECANAHSIDPTWVAEWAPAACGAVL